MKKYEDVVLDVNGNAIVGASVTVKDYPSGTSSTIYSDNAGTTTTNPLTTDADGRFSAYLKNGAYSFQISKTGVTTETQTNVTVTDTDDFVSAIGYGIIGDGTTDNYAAIVAAVTAAKAAGKRSIFFPAGKYLIDTDGGSISLSDISFVGPEMLDGWQSGSTPTKGACFFLTGTTNSPFKVGRGVQLKNLGFYYPNQSDSATPTAYPPTIDFDFTDTSVQYVHVDRCVAYNAYRFIRINDASGSVGHVWITNNAVYGIHRCVEITNNAEVIQILNNDFTFGVWAGSTEAGSRDYTRASGYCIQYDKGDGIFVRGNLIFGYARGISIGAGNGTTQLTRIADNTFDQCLYGIYASGSGNWTTSNVTGNTFYCFDSQDHSVAANGIHIVTSGSGSEIIHIVNNIFALSTEDAVYVNDSNAARQLLVSGNSFQLWAAYKAAGNYGAIYAYGALTNLVAVGNMFYGYGYEGYATAIKGTVNTLTVYGNFMNTVYQAVAVTTNAANIVANCSFTTGASASDAVTATTEYSIGNNWDKPALKTPVAVPLALMASYADDAAAAAAGVPVGGLYRTSGAINIRVA